MAKAPKKEMMEPSDQPVELEPNAWERFEAAVDKAAKAPPQHRSTRNDERKPEGSNADRRSG